MVVGGVVTLTYDKVGLFRFINRHYWPITDYLMYYATWMGQAEVIIPVLAAVMLLPKYRNLWYFSLATACNVAPALILQLLKTFFNKPRPMHYFEHADWVHMVDHWDRVFTRSFPSGHSEGAFSFFCFLSLLLMHKYRAWGVVFFILGIAVCYSRVYLAAHFFEDVYAGSILGVVVCTVVYVMMHKYAKRYFKTT